MKAAVTSTSRFIDGSIGTKTVFGRYMLIFDFDSMEYEAIINPINALKDMSAIELFAEILSQEDISVLFINDCNPAIKKTLEYSGIEVIEGMYGIVRDVLKNFTKVSNSDSKFATIKALNI